MRRSVLAVIVVVFGFAACGGGDDEKSDTSDGGSTTTTTRKPPKSAGSDPADPDVLIDALAASITNDPEAPAGLTDDKARCLAQAVVDTFGPQPFADAGLTPSDLADPDVDLGDLESTTEQQQVLGAAMQDCQLGGLFAPLLLEAFGGDESETQCAVKKLDSDERAESFLGESILIDTPSATSATDLVHVVADCIDLGRFAVEQSGLPLTPEETTCVSTKLTDSEAFFAGIAAVVAGNDGTEEPTQQVVLDALTTCLTPERLVEIGAPSASTS